MTRKGANMQDMLFFYAKSIEFMSRFLVTIPIMVMKGKIVKIGRPTIRKENPVNREFLQGLCNWMGFTWQEP